MEDFTTTFLKRLSIFFCESYLTVGGGHSPNTLFFITTHKIRLSLKMFLVQPILFLKFLGKSQLERPHKRGSYKAKECTCTLATTQLAVSVLLILQ